MPHPLTTGIETLQTALQGINSSSSPYTVTVTRVEKRSRDWAMVGEELRPYIGIHLSNAPHQYLPSHQIFVDANVHLVCLLALIGRDEEERLSDQLILLDNIKRAVSTVSGSGLVSTTIVDAQFDASDVDAQNAMRVILIMRYRVSALQVAST